MIFILAKDRHKEAINRLRREGIDFLTKQIPDTERWYIQAPSSALSVIFPYLLDYWNEPAWWRNEGED